MSSFAVVNARQRCAATLGLVNSSMSVAFRSLTSSHATPAQEFSPEDAETLRLPDAIDRIAPPVDPFVALENAVTGDGAFGLAAPPAMSTRSSPARDSGDRLHTARPHRRHGGGGAAAATAFVDDVDDEEVVHHRRGPQAQQQARAGIAALHARSVSVSKDDYTVNKALRRAMRAQRTEHAALDRHRHALGLPEHIQLLPAAPEDAAVAAAMQFGRAALPGGGFRHDRRAKRAALRTAPVLPGVPPPSATGALLAKKRKLEAAGVRFAQHPSKGGLGPSSVLPPAPVVVRKAVTTAPQKT